MTPDQEKRIEFRQVQNGTELPAVIRLQRIVALLVLICLVVSACLNVYVLFENRALRDRVSAIQERLKGYGEMHRKVRDITLDLGVLSRTEATVRKLLIKHKQFFSKFRLHDMTRGVPQRQALTCLRTTIRRLADGSGNRARPRPSFSSSNMA